MSKFTQWAEQGLGRFELLLPHSSREQTPQAPHRDPTETEIPSRDPKTAFRDPSTGRIGFGGLSSLALASV